MRAEPTVAQTSLRRVVQEPPGFVRPLDSGDAPALEKLAGCWPTGRQMSEQLAALLYGGFEPLFRALAAPDHLLAGASVHGDAGEPLGWMALVRHHERAGYAGTARLLFDLDERAPDGSLDTLHRVCRSSPRAHGIRVAIGFADDASPALSRGYTALGFRPTGELRLGAHGHGCIRVYALETPHDH